MGRKQLVLLTSFGYLLPLQRGQSHPSRRNTNKVHVNTEQIPPTYFIALVVMKPAWAVGKQAALSVLYRVFVTQRSLAEGTWGAKSRCESQVGAASPALICTKMP